MYAFKTKALALQVAAFAKALGFTTTIVATIEGFTVLAKEAN